MRDEKVPKLKSLVECHQPRIEQMVKILELRRKSRNFIDREQFEDDTSMLCVVRHYQNKNALLRATYYLYVIPSRVELETYCLEGSCSIQLSYGTFIYS